jgi:glutathione S-transferase
MLTKPRLTYFDAPMSRGEECRLALHIGGVDFEDRRLKREEWLALKPTTPFGSVPLFEMPGSDVALAQSNAILVFVGRRHGLHPKDDLEAARHEAIMSSVEELRAMVTPTMRMTDEAQKKSAREQLAATAIPTWGANVEKLIGEGPFFGGAAVNVVDLKLHMLVRWFRGGALDHIPTTVLADFPKLNRVCDAVADHERVKDWNAKTTK